jgi:hypothetical protein
MSLTVAPNLPRPDEAYARLIAAHEGLSEAESHALNARLVLILMNQIGDDAVLAQALAAARAAGRAGRGS